MFKLSIFSESILYLVRVSRIVFLLVEKKKRDNVHQLGFHFFRFCFIVRVLLFNLCE